MSELPANWTIAGIEETLLPFENKQTLRQGWSPQCERFPAQSDDDWGVLKTTAIQDGEFQPDHNKQLPANLEPDELLEVEVGDLLLTCAGPRVRCGVICLVRKTRPRLMISGKMYRFRTDERIALPAYLEAFLRAHDTKKRIDAMKTGISDSGLNLTLSRFKTLQVPLPPLAEQRRIVGKVEELFSELEEGVANLKQARAQLAVYRQALLKHAFEGHLTAGWRAKHLSMHAPQEQVLEQLNETRMREYEKRLKQWEELFERWKLKRPNAKPPTPPARPKLILSCHSDPSLPSLPTGWLYIKVGDLSDVVRGGSPRPAGDPKFYDGDIPFLKVADLTRKEGVFVDSYAYTIKEAGLQKTRFVMPPTLLISNSGATLGVPKVCTIEATFNDGVAAFLGVPEPEQLYHYYFWESRTQQLRSIDQGAAQPNLNTDLLRDYLVPVCSNAEMTEVTNRLAEQLSTISTLEADIDLNLQKAEALRQSILKKAFAGELVPQDPADEPAAALLARIRAEREAQAAGNPKKKPSRLQKGAS